VTGVKRFLAFALIVAVATGLSSCGFTPLYGKPAVVADLAAIDVQAPDGRIGFLVKESLDDAFARNRSAPPSYKMQLSIGEARYPRGVRIDNVATRYEYVITTNYVLINLPSGTVAKRGSVHVEVTYDSADQPYASIAAQQDAQQRGATEAARRIQLEIAAWMANGKKH
jgi:LPS-assembly lipoprotein